MNTSGRNSKEFLKIKKERMEDIGRCELCGSRRNLELHHCVPLLLGGGDTDDNLILICQCCHSKITPKSTLTKIGINKLRGDRKSVYVDIFYSMLNEKCDTFDIGYVMDIFDECIGVETLAEARYKITHMYDNLLERKEQEKECYEQMTVFDFIEEQEERACL